MLYWMIGIALTVLVFYLIISFYVFRFFADRSFSKDILFKGKNSEEVKSDNTLHFNYEEMYINSVDSVQLHSYVVRNIGSFNWIICVHGYSGNATNLLPQIKHFSECGYNVLAIDLRAHGKSQGKYFGLSYLDAKDIKLWIEWILETTPNASIALFGLSLGGASVLMTASNKLDERVKCVISDSAPTDFSTQFKHVWSWFVKIPSKIILPAINMWMKIFAKYSLHDASPINNIKNIKIPCLIIHGKQDHFVQETMAHEIFEEIKGFKELLIVPNADHTQSSKVDPTAYWKKVDSFLLEHM